MTMDDQADPAMNASAPFTENAAQAKEDDDLLLDARGLMKAYRGRKVVNK